MKQGIFDEVKELPDIAAKRRYDSLVGIDEIKQRIVKEAMVMLDPTGIKSWIDRHHPGVVSWELSFKEHTPLLIFAGDVGTGKSVLAETLADPLARAIGIGATLYSLSLSARGTGAVGEMTALLAAAFSEIRGIAAKGRRPGARPTHVTVLLIDEADALAQSREMSQMHHEDRAGVNAIIRGVDDLAAEQMPILVIMCTNRLDAIDPAVRRRAAVTIEFKWPNDVQRQFILERAFSEIGFTATQISSFVKETGPSRNCEYGVTFSDLVQRFIPEVILSSFPDNPVTFDSASEIAKTFVPTPPFKGE